MVRRERRHAVLTVGVDVVRTSAGKVEVLVRDLAVIVVLTLDLRSGGREEVDRARAGVTAIGGRAEVATVVARHVRPRIAGVGRGVRVRRRDVGRVDLRAGRRLRCLLGRRHAVDGALLVHVAELLKLLQVVELLEVIHLVHLVHAIHPIHAVHAVELLHLVELAHLVHLIHLVHLVHLGKLVELLEGGVVVHAGLDGGGGCGSRDMLLVAAARVGVVVYSRVARKLVGTAEALGAAGELAGVRLLAGVRPDVARLVLEAVEGLVAERALVGARQVGAVLVRVLHVDSHCRHGHGGGGHRRAGLAVGLAGLLRRETGRGRAGRGGGGSGRGRGVGVAGLRRGLNLRAALGVQQVREHVGWRAGAAEGGVRGGRDATGGGGGGGAECGMVLCGGGGSGVGGGGGCVAACAGRVQRVGLLGGGGRRVCGEEAGEARRGEARRATGKEGFRKKKRRPLRLCPPHLSVRVGI